MLAQTMQATGQPWYLIEYLNNAAWRWGALLGVLVVTLAIGRIVSFILARHGRRLIDGQSFIALGTILRSLASPSALLILAAGLYSAASFMRLDHVLFTQATGEVIKTPEGIASEVVKVRDLAWLWKVACNTLAVVAAGWAVYRLVDLLELYLLKWTSRTHTQLDDQLVPIFRKSLRIFTVIVVALFIAQNVLEMRVGALLAGLGIGGLALALAAKDTLSNFFGSLTIFADRPFQMGERVNIDGHNGTVEEVGFRSTRIRTRAGHLVTLPNAYVANSAVENIGRRPYIRRVLDVTITYDTQPDKVQRAIDIIREMLDARAEHFPDDMPGRVYFSEFNPASLNIVVYYWFTPPDWWEYLAFTDKFNTELLRRFNDEGIEFAFPTQTLYVKGDPPAEANLGQRPGPGE